MKTSFYEENKVQHHAQHSSYSRNKEFAQVRAEKMQSSGTVGENQGYINHIAFLLDASTSMEHLESTVIRVADAQIASIAQASKKADQETRASIYSFASCGDTRCAFFDKDVMRLPSLKGHYATHGKTALIDATLKVLSDLQNTNTQYGDHAFVVFIITDGAENASFYGSKALKEALASLPDEWSIGLLVPGAAERMAAINLGFEACSVRVWDPTQKGTEELFEELGEITTNYMVARAKGQKVTNIFDLTKENVAAAEKSGQLSVVHGSAYRFLPVEDNAYTPKNERGKIEIASFCQYHVGSYKSGSAYYPLTKRETIQGAKRIAIRETSTGKVYVGQVARQMVGLPVDGSSKRIRPETQPGFEVFVQITSQNRVLIPGTELLYFNYDPEKARK